MMNVEIKNIIDAMGTKYLCHPDNQVKRITKAKKALCNVPVKRVKPFKKSPKQLRAALGAV